MYKYSVSMRKPRHREDKKVARVKAGFGGRQTGFSVCTELLQPIAAPKGLDSS